MNKFLLILFINPLNSTSVHVFKVQNGTAAIGHEAFTHYRTPENLSLLLSHLNT